jgi:hypothetical protein
VGALPQGGECLEVRNTVAILDNGLTIDNCRLAFEVRCRANERWITVGPIKSIASEDPRLPALNQHLAAVAIVFDFMNPVLPLWRLIDEGWKLWLDESEPGGYTKHWGFAGVFEPGTADRGTVFY